MKDCPRVNEEDQPVRELVKHGNKNNIYAYRVSTILFLPHRFDVNVQGPLFLPRTNPLRRVLTFLHHSLSRDPSA